MCHIVAFKKVADDIMLKFKEQYKAIVKEFNFDLESAK